MNRFSAAKFFGGGIFPAGEVALAGRGKLIRASEVGEYVYCARAWRLRREGVERTRGHEARAAGTAWHLEHGRGVTAARQLRKLSAAAGLLALLCALALAALWLWPR